MASDESTILKMLLSQHLDSIGYSKAGIADELYRLGLKDKRTGKKLSVARIGEYLEGINKQRSTGVKKEIK